MVSADPHPEARRARRTLLMLLGVTVVSLALWIVLASAVYEALI